MARLQFVVLIGFLALVAAENQALSQLGNVDMDSLLADPAKADATIKCLLEDAGDSCSAEGKIIRILVAEMVKNNCADCSEPHKAAMMKLMGYVTKNRPDDVPKLRTKYDPKGEYIAKYGESLRAQGVKV